jgi:hypothetical protein
MSGAKHQLVSTNLATYFGCKGSRDNVEKCIQDQVQQYLDSSRAEILDEVKDQADSDLWDGDRFEYYHNDDVSIQYDENDILVLRENTSEYTGGAHGMYGTLLQVLDLANNKVLKLRDVTTADSVTLEHLLEMAFRKDYHLKKTDSLSDLLFDNSLAANDNFYITRKGLGFLYNPYEVASFAAGIIEVFIPFKEMKGLLSPWFVKRMGL